MNWLESIGMISYQTPVNQDNDDDLGVYWVPIVEE